MAKKKRTYNTRRIKRNLSYTVQEVAELYGLHKNVVLRWIKDGLPVIDGRKPYLIYGVDLADYLDGRQKRRKQKCAPDEFYCCKCRAPRKAWENQADIVIKNESKLSVSALCAVCDTALHRMGAVKKLAEYQKIFSIQTTQGPHITDRASPSVMCDMKKEART